jgi:hypothetical protein
VELIQLLEGFHKIRKRSLTLLLKRKKSSHLTAFEMEYHLKESLLKRKLSPGLEPASLQTGAAPLTLLGLWSSDLTW